MDLSPLREAIAKSDKARASCPVGSGNYFGKPCPKCRATDRDACGPSVSADYHVSMVVRDFLREHSA